jgi:hypothetical protein
MFLLTIVTNAPEISQSFFAALYQKLGDRKPEQTFTAADWQSLPAPDSAPPEWAAIQAFLASKAAILLKTVHASRLAWWAQRVTCFSFQIEPGALEWLERVAQHEVPAK